MKTDDALSAAEPPATHSSGRNCDCGLQTMVKDRSIPMMMMTMLTVFVGVVMSRSRTSRSGRVLA
jgi:hypothetical protein